MAKEKKRMTEIYKELELLNTDKEKYSYLEELSKRIGKDIKLSRKDKKAFYKTLGDYAIALDKLDEAIEAYEKAGFKEGFIKVGDKLFEKGQLHAAAGAYGMAGFKEGIIKVGDKWFEEGRFDDAIWAYEITDVVHSGGLAEMEKLINAYEKVGKGEKAKELRKQMLARFFRLRK
jgi:tetratricopeptide (TPR) repeat protein